MQTGSQDDCLTGISTNLAEGEESYDINFVILSLLEGRDFLFTEYTLGEEIKVKKYSVLLIFVLIISLLIGACSSTTPVEEVDTAAESDAEDVVEVVEPGVEEEPEAEEPVEEEPAEETRELLALVDGFDREFTLEVPVERIVSLAPSNVEVLFAIGAGDLVVGRDDTTDFPEEALEIESIGSTWGELNTEVITAMEPDVVLGAGLTSPEQISQLEELGIPVFVLENPSDFEGLYDNLEIAGKLTGHEAEAQALIVSLDERVEAVEQKMEGAEPVTVFYEVDGTDPAAPWTAGAGTFHDYVITQTGGENIAADIEYYNTLSAEEIIAADPDVIVFAEGPWVPTTAESIGERPGWDVLSAVTNGQVYGIDTNWFDRPGPRLVNALETMAEYLHPEVFE